MKNREKERKPTKRLRIAMNGVGIERLDRAGKHRRQLVRQWTTCERGFAVRGRHETRRECVVHRVRSMRNANMCTTRTASRTKVLSLIIAIRHLVSRDTRIRKSDKDDEPPCPGSHSMNRSRTSTNWAGSCCSDLSWIGVHACDPTRVYEGCEACEQIQDEDTPVCSCCH